MFAPWKYELGSPIAGKFAIGAERLPSVVVGIRVKIQNDKTQTGAYNLDKLLYNEQRDRAR